MISAAKIPLALGMMASLPVVNSHEHDDERIPEGATVSTDPIVWSHLAENKRGV